MKAVNVEPNWPMMFDLEPSWPMMFDFAVAQVKAVVAKGDTRDFIVEMLEFGKRLEEKENGIKGSSLNSFAESLRSEKEVRENPNKEKLNAVHS